MGKFTTEQIFDTATSDEGMNKNQTVMFHLFNPNGLVAKLPEFEDFCHGDIFYTGNHMLYGKHENYYAKWLREVVGKPGRYNKWTLAYHLNELAHDVDRAWKKIEAKKAAA
jgi:hypothetical protein